MPVFVWNDETVVNSYGFRVLNGGISLKRFAGNPVMLNSHVNTTKMTLGTWKDWKTEGFKLQGETVFDSAREDVKEVEGQVDRNVIKACSMGLGIDWDEDTWQKAPDGVWELVKCELMEVSICAVPSNSGALALFDKSTGKLIAEDQFKLSLKNLSAEKVKPNNPKMEKIILTPNAMSALLAAGVTAPDNGAEISRGVEKLQVDLAASNNKVTELQGKIDAQVDLQAKALADQAVLDGKITQTEHADLLADAKANYALTAKLVAKMPGKASLSALVNNTTAATSDVKTIDDFEKLSDEKKLAFKTESPDAYKALFA